MGLGRHQHQYHAVSPQPEGSQTRSWPLKSQYGSKRVEEYVLGDWKTPLQIVLQYWGNMNWIKISLIVCFWLYFKKKGNIPVVVIHYASNLDFSLRLQDLFSMKSDVPWIATCSSVVWDKIPENKIKTETEKDIHAQNMHSHSTNRLLSFETDCPNDVSSLDLGFRVAFFNMEERVHQWSSVSACVRVCDTLCAQCLWSIKWET